MDDLIFQDENPTVDVKLKDILKEEGRSQIWLRTKLEEYGIKRDKAQVSQYCTGKCIPKDEYILRAIAEIIGRDFEEIQECFKR